MHTRTSAHVARAPPQCGVAGARTPMHARARARASSPLRRAHAHARPPPPTETTKKGRTAGQWTARLARSRGTRRHPLASSPPSHAPDDRVQTGWGSLPFKRPARQKSSVGGRGNLCLERLHFGDGDGARVAVRREASAREDARSKGEAKWSMRATVSKCVVAAQERACSLAREHAR
eukprot:1688185-Pleurochrysis_carterae.AAC.1